MVKVRDLTELKVEDLWREVKGDEEWWGDLKQETLRMVKRLLESAMKEELLECLRVGRYRRTGLRRGYRNGYRDRNQLIEPGLVGQLEVPWDREGVYQPSVLERYRRRQVRVNQLIREVFPAGVSTRRVCAVLAPVIGETPSPQTVPRVARALDAEVSQYHTHHLQDHYQYVFLDGIALKGKSMTGGKETTGVMRLRHHP